MLEYNWAFQENYLSSEKTTKLTWFPAKKTIVAIQN